MKEGPAIGMKLKVTGCVICQESPTTLDKITN